MQTDVIYLQERKQSEENKEQIKQDLIDGLIDKLSKDQILAICELFDDVAKSYIVSKGVKKSFKNKQKRICL